MSCHVAHSAITGLPHDGIECEHREGFAWEALPLVYTTAWTQIGDEEAKGMTVVASVASIAVEMPSHSEPQPQTL